MSGPQPLYERQMQRATAWGRVMVIGMILLMGFQLARVVQLKITPNEKLAAHVGSTMSSRPEFAKRGDVIDRRGRVVATSSLGYRLFVDPKLVRDHGTIAAEIADAIGADPVEIDREIIPRRDRRYVVIRHLLEDWQVDAIRRANIRGVGLQPRLVRHYPNGELAAGLIGMVGFEHTGLGGMEHRFDEQLEPQSGRLTYLRDARQRALWIEPAGYEPGRSGETVRLSLDLVIQEIVERHMRNVVASHNAGGGRMVVLDSQTGEVLGLTDILNPREGWEEQTEDPMREHHAALGRNRCVTDPYEPGSTFKPFIWAVATELGKVTLEERLDTPATGDYRTGRGRRISDAFNYGNATWHDVMIKSLNSGMAIVAERMSERQMQEAVARFGFGRRTNCGLPGESRGIVTSPRAWNHYTQTSVSMGHEIAVTPMQMVQAFAVFARDGTLPRVRLTALHPDERELEVNHRILSDEITRKTRRAMRDVMTEGTGRRAQSEKYQLFSKSGTAQLPRRDGGGYHERRYVASFIAGAPYTDPRIVVLCVIDDPDPEIGYYGGAVAGPVVRDVVDEVLVYLGVEPDQPEAGPALVFGGE